MSVQEPNRPGDSRPGASDGQRVKEELSIDEGEEQIEFLYLPPGRYPLSGTLTLPMDVHALAAAIPGTKACRMSLVEYLRLVEEWKMQSAERNAE